MRYQNDGRSRGGDKEYCHFGDNGSSDGRAYSSSSGNSNRPARSARPMIRPSSNPVNRVRTPEQSNAGHNRADSPMALETLGSERSSSALHSYQISDTYRHRPSAITSSTKPPSSASSAATTNNARQYPKGQYTSSRSLTRNAGSHWALNQELKLKLVGIPKCYWTKDVYFATSEFGTVMKIDIQTGSRDNIAWIVFQ